MFRFWPLGFLILTMDKKIIIKNFSRYAYCYDKYAHVQKLAAEKLLSTIKEENFNSVLEIGCGSGNYTALLRGKFVNARLKAIDISATMVDIAKDKLKNSGVEFIVEDAENMDSEENFELITSNACFQWFDDLEGALSKYRTLLNNDGIISFSIFGPATFCELNESLRSVTGASVAAGNFMDRAKIEAILIGNFRKIVIEEIRHVEFFSHLKDLFDKIKYTGIRGEGTGGRFFLGTELFKKLEDYYRDNFFSVDDGSGIRATYQIFLCRGQKA